MYARVSTEHEAQINALENQLEWYKIECSRHSDWEIVEVYVDQGITGTQAQKRPEFLRMMEDAQKGKFDLIITREVSRFARNTVDTLSYTRELKARGVDVFFINDGINTATNDGELRLTIMSSMAQDESRKISERVKAGQKISREKHVLYGSGNILGYRRANGTYVPDPDQAETVRLIFQMYSTGENGLVKIVNELYRLGRLDAGGHVSWDASKVSRVLHNATYKGCIYHDKISDTIEDIDNEAMRQGRDLEDYVAQRFSEETGLKVRRANAIYQSEEHPLLLADFDRLIVGQKAGLECKTVSPFSADKWANGKIPAHYLAQVDHYLAVSGFDCWYVAALILGKELIIHKIVTDKQVLTDLIDKEELFWTRYVVPHIPPAPNGSEGDTQQINQMYEVDDRDKNADLTSLRGLLDKRQELSDQIEQMEQEKTAIEQQVKLKMQDAAYGTAPGYKVSWVSSESKRVDSQRLKKEQPDIFNQYSKNVSSRRFTIVHAA